MTDILLFNSTIYNISSRTKLLNISDIEKKIISTIQGDIPICKNPYAILAESINITESEFIGVLSKLKEKGLIRRFGATLRHQKSGFSSNAMVAWKAEEEKVVDIGKKMGSFTEVSHCYRRSPELDWKYNLYTMVHEANKDACLEKVNQISKATGVTEYEILFSVRELKKTSMVYFRHNYLEDEDD